MEGIGSRLGRVSSRHGSSSTPTVFNGSVRKWKRQWVVTSEPTPPTDVDNVLTVSGNKCKGRHQKRNATRPLLLCRWTPLTSDMLPPKRKFRYTPVIVFDQVKKEVCDDSKLNTVCSSEANMTEENDIPFQESKFSDSCLKDMKESRSDHQ